MENTSEDKTSKRIIESLTLITNLLKPAVYELVHTKPAVYELVYTKPASDGHRTLPVTRRIYATDLLDAFKQSQELLNALDILLPLED